MKFFIPLALLLQLGSAQASLIGVMDSGTDITHRDLAPKTWYNPNEKVGDVDLDRDGLPGDVNGWDFTTGTAKTFDPQYNYLIDNDVKTFFLLYSKYETRTINMSEIAWLQAHVKDEVLMNKANFVGGYIHGTHVAGISAVNNPKAKILSFKVIPADYTMPLAPMVGNTEVPAPQAPAISFEDFKKEVLDSVAPQVEELGAFHALMNFHKVDVVNESFGIGFGDAAGFIQKSFIELVKREPTEAELISLVSIFMNQLIATGPKVFQAAPTTLFAIAAGNDSVNNDVVPDFPANIQAENKIVVAATLGYNQLAEFSNYGATKVDVAAPGVAITSTAPTNAYIPLSGTSQATPFVTNVIAMIKDINPNLSIRDVKSIIFETVDKKPWLVGKVKTSGIVNKSRALKAANYTKTLNITLAISKARAEIADVLVNKSFGSMPLGSLSRAFNLARPSLLGKKIK